MLHVLEPMISATCWEWDGRVGEWVAWGLSFYLFFCLPREPSSTPPTPPTMSTAHRGSQTVDAEWLLCCIVLSIRVWPVYINADRTATHFIGSSLEVSVKRRPGRHPAATYRSGRGRVWVKRHEKKDWLSKNKHTPTTGKDVGSSLLALRPVEAFTERLRCHHA